MKQFYFLLFFSTVLKLCIGQGFTPFKENGKYGFRNSNNEVVIQPQYDYVSLFSEKDDLYRVSKYNIGTGRRMVVGVIDMKGNVIVDFIYQSIGGLSDGHKGAKISLADSRAYVVKWGVKGYDDRKMGYIDGYGNVKIPIIYDNTDKNFYPENQYVPISKNGKWGFIDRNGKIIVELKYQYASDASYDRELGDYMFWIQNNHKTYPVNSNGECVRDCDYAGVPFAPSVLAAREETRKKQEEQNRIADERRQNELRQNQQEEARLAEERKQNDLRLKQQEEVRLAEQKRKKEEESRLAEIKKNPMKVVNTDCVEKNGWLWGDYEECTITFADGTIGTMYYDDDHYLLCSGVYNCDVKHYYQTEEYAAKAAYKKAHGGSISSEGRYDPNSSYSSSSSSSSSSFDYTYKGEWFTNGKYQTRKIEIVKNGTSREMTDISYHLKETTYHRYEIKIESCYFTTYSENYYFDSDESSNNVSSVSVLGYKDKTLGAANNIFDACKLAIDDYLKKCR